IRRRSDAPLRRSLNACTNVGTRSVPSVDGSRSALVGRMRTFPSCYKIELWVVGRSRFRIPTLIRVTLQRERPLDGRTQRGVSPRSRRRQCFPALASARPLVRRVRRAHLTRLHVQTKRQEHLMILRASRLSFLASFATLLCTGCGSSVPDEAASSVSQSTSLISAAASAPS